jgi:hypothetical protein
LIEGAKMRRTAADRKAEFQAICNRVDAISARLNDKLKQNFTDYVMSFYGPDSELYPEFGFNETQINLATGIYKMRLEAQGKEFCGDSIDRENVRDLILEARSGTLPEFKKA